jgi:hypothetical protein
MNATDTEMIDFLIKNKCDIEAPYEDETTWVVYNQKQSLGAGLGCSKDLRKAIQKSIEFLNK